MTVALATTMLAACASFHAPNYFSAAAAPTASAQTVSEQTQADVTYGTVNVDGVDIFYRQAGGPSKQAVVLLHGFPSSSHMYREVLAELGDEYYLIAPDYPGFGDSGFPAREDYTYTFDNLAHSIDGFLEQMNISNYVLMIQDYGAPVGMRVAVEHPERVAGIISMNGNVYEEGINKAGWLGPGDPVLE